MRKFCVLTLLQFHGNTSSITAKLCLVSTQNLLANHSCSIMRYCLNSRFPLFLSLAQIADMCPLRKMGTAEEFFYRRGAQCAPMPRHIRSVGYCSATQAVYSEQAQHNSVAQLVSLEFTDSTCECRRLVQFIFVGAGYHNALSNCAALLSPRGPSLALRAIHLVPHLAESCPYV